MNPGTEVILGVSGGIAAYKVADLASRLRQAGAAVHTVMTRAATRFVAPLTFQSVTGNPVYVDMFEPPRQWSVEHIALADRAHLLLVAPATANVLGKFSAGIADDYLCTMYLAVDCPVVVCPAMNYRMWAHPAVQESARTLRSRGVTVMEPAEGRLASGAVGRGRLPAVEDILAEVDLVLGASSALRGFTVMVTAGPTRERIDAVRYISSPSTGKMGYAVAAELARAGAKVILVSGPTWLPAPGGVDLVRVESAVDMHREVLARLDEVDAVVKAAAVSDFRPAATATAKIKKADMSRTISLEPNPDILLEIGRRKGAKVLMGFAAETGDGEKEAVRKLRDKNLDLLVLNRVDEPGSGFAVDTNRVVIYRSDGTELPLPAATKDEVARQLCRELAAALAGRGGGDGGAGGS